MPADSIEDLQEFARLWADLVEKKGLMVEELAKRLGLKSRAIYAKRDRTQTALGIVLRANHYHARAPDLMPVYEHTTLQGPIHALIGSDWHIWPGQYSRSEEAFYKALESDKFDAVILNGDVTDQCRVSRHDPLYAVETPSLADELSEAQGRLKTVSKLAKKKNPAVRLLWNMGNHDVRAWRQVAMLAPEIAPMFDFEKLFPDWEFGNSIAINDNVIIKHRWHNGLHAALNNVRNSGKSIITGHTHRLCVTPWGDYSGVRYGIECGTLADPRGPQFAFVENNPVNWCPGFIELFADEHDVHAERIDCSRKVIRRLGKPLKVA